MSKPHTPGPWEVQEVGVGELFVVKPDGEGGSWGICEMSNDYAGADARLIAAAPDLYVIVDEFFTEWSVVLNQTSRRGADLATRAYQVLQRVDNPSNSPHEASE